MKNRKDEKWLDETISRAVDFGEVKFDVEKWKRKYFLDKSKTPSTIKPHKNVWRVIMESKATRYSAAAVVVLAFVLVLFNPFGASKNGGVVWAEVIDKVHQMRTVTFKEQYLFWEIGQEESYLESNASKFDAVKYASEENGVAEDVFGEKDKLAAQVYTSPGTKQFILVLHAEKKYRKLSMPGDWLNRITEVLTPRGFLEYFTSGQYTELGPAEFDNINVEGFETSDPNIVFPIPETLRLMFPVKDMVVRIWIDAKTSFPVGIEAEFNTERGLFTGFEKLHCEYRAYDFQWNAEIPKGIFEPNIPDDYTQFKVTDLIPTEAKAGIIGLGIILIPGSFISRRKHERKKTGQVGRQ